MRLTLVTTLVATILAFGVVPDQTAHAAAFDSIPKRLYMVPAGGNTTLPGGLPSDITDLFLGLKVGVLDFDGSTDLISQEAREIVVTATEGPLGCALVDEPVGIADYEDDDCTSLVLSASIGRIRVADKSVLLRDHTSDPDGAGPLVAGDPNPNDWVWRMPDDGNANNGHSGALVSSWGGGDDGTDPVSGDPDDDGDPNDPDGYSTITLHGTTEMLNNALATLEFIAPDGYHFHGEDPSTSITLTMAGGDGVSPPIETIQIRVQEVNQFPTHSGPQTYDAPTATEVIVPTPPPWNVEDEDNDEDVDGAEADPPEAEETYTDFDGVEHVIPDGAYNEMLFIAWLDCGTAPLVDTGVHFASSNFAPVVGTLREYLEPKLDPEGNNAVFIDAAIEALELIAPGIADTEIQTADETFWTTFYAGVGTMKSVRDALVDVTFRHDTPNDTCELITIVSDLGNNGLPVQWLEEPPSNGTEIPMLGFDWNELTINTGEIQEIDIRFDSASPITVEEVNGPEDVGASLIISPANHPGFTMSWDARPIVGDAPVPGLATANDDFNGTSNNSLIVEPGVTSIPWPADPLDLTSEDAPSTGTRADDGEFEGHEMFSFVLVIDDDSHPDGWMVTSSLDTRTVVILDDEAPDPPKTITSVSDPTVLEGDAGTTTLTFEVGLSAPAAGYETFTVDTVDGSATSPADFTAVEDRIVTFAAGAQTAEIDVTVLGDVLPEDDPHTFTLQISDPQNVNLGADTTGTGSIDDDDEVDPGPPTIAITDDEVTEGNAGVTNANFTVTLSAPAPAGGVTIDHTTADGTAFESDNDYETTTGTTTIAQGATTATITVPVNGDTKVEPNETFTVTLSNPMGATIADGTATGTITNDDQPSVISIADNSIPEGNIGPITVSMTSPTRTCTVEINTGVVGDTASDSGVDADYTDLSAAPVTLAAVPNTAIDLTTLEDTDIEGNETLTATIALANGADPDCQLGDATATITITDDDDAVPDPPTLGIADIETLEGDAGVTSWVFTITSSAPAPAAGISVDYTTFDGTAFESDNDYETSTGTTFFPEGASSATISVPVNGDTRVEANETFTVSLSNPMGASIADGTASGTITNDDQPSVLSIADTTIPEGNVGPITVSMTSPVRTCTVEVTTTDVSTTDTGPDADYDPLTAAAVVLPAVPNTTTDLTTLEDTEIEGNETLTATIVLGSGTDPDCQLGDATATVTISDDDDAVPDPPTASIADVTVTEGDAGITNANFTVTLSAPAPAGGVTVDFATSNGTATIGNNDYESTAGTRTFTAGATTRTISVPVNGDTTVENNETFRVTLTNAGGATIADGLGIGTITNDDDVPPAPVDQLTIDVPDDIVREAGPGQPGVAVTWPAVTSTGGVPPVTITCSHQSGDFFPIGMTIVSCSASDSAPPQQLALGRSSLDVVAALTVSATFSVTVVAQQAPPVQPPVPSVPPAAPPSAPSPSTGFLPATGSSVRSVLVLASLSVLVGLALSTRRRAVRR